MSHRERLEILCPRCSYRPSPHERWVCDPGCGTWWNTFWTRGLCPGCAKLWDVTQCPECGSVSPHKHWYRAPGRQERRQPTEEPVDAG
jgi:hypothetical protein